MLNVEKINKKGRVNKTKTRITFLVEYCQL